MDVILYDWAGVDMSGFINRHNEVGIRSKFQMGQISPTKYFFGIAFVLGLLFAFISNAEDDNLPLYMIFLQWQLQTLLPISIIITVHILFGQWRVFERLNPWMQLVITGFIGVILFTPIAWSIDWLMLNNQEPNISLSHQLLDEFLGVGPPVLITWLAINAPWLLGFRIEKTIQSESKETQNQFTESEFMAHLPTEVKGEIIMLKSELHYLEVTTTEGFALVLYNLKDAIDELKELSGVQPHRSYWVNLCHIKALKKKGREGMLEMSNKTKIPISRYRMQEVVDACAVASIKLN